MITKNDALRKAALLKKTLVQKGIPVQEVFLFGSYAEGREHADSDIDVAVICIPFRKSKLDEGAALLWESKDIDLKIEPICLHPEDMENRYSTLVQEIKKHGIPVS